MNRAYSEILFIITGVLAMLLLLASWGIAGNKANSRVGGGRSVWLVFFSSKDCGRCAQVKDLIDVLASEYPLKVKVFDVSNDTDYALLRRLEAIHARKKFSVPLVIVGDSILMGERRITAGLEKIVSRLARGPGASLPYLGPQHSEAPVPEGLSRCRDCERNGRPPSIEEEWGRIKHYLNKFF